MYTLLQNFLKSQGVTSALVTPTATTVTICVILILAFVAHWIAKHIFVPLFEKAMLKTKNDWDDVLIDRKFFPTLARLVPIVFIYVAADLLFTEQPITSETIKRISLTLFSVIGVQCINTLLLIIQDTYSRHEISKSRPISGYLSIFKIAYYVFAAILIIAILTNKSPWGILSVLGGLTAILLLIFKDTILGFVASLQLFNLDMVRVGDWIEMPKFSADGDVVEVTIHTVKVQNWDKTITTIPTYALVTNAFRNWRGMNESGGRRIKRHICLDMNSIRFCTNEMLDKFAKLNLLKDYLSEKQSEINTYNKAHNIDPSNAQNGRSQTNIGIFRAYVKAYLANNPKIHKDMTFLVRQLAPTAKGLPIEIYVFSNDQRWAFFEEIQADIFDHILAIIPEFELKVFQEPTGGDFGKLYVNTQYNGCAKF